MTRGRVVFGEALLLAAAGLLLSLPAIVNQFPLTFHDTPRYLYKAFYALHGHVEPRYISEQQYVAPGAGPLSDNPFFLRPFPYSVFLLPFANDYLVWLIPPAQGALAAYLIRRALSAAGLTLPPAAFLALILGLALFSSLGVLSSYLMADLFTGLLILAAFAVPFGWRERGPAGRLFDVVLVAFLAGVHLSHLMLTMGLVGILALYALATRRRRLGFAALGFGLVLPLGLAVAALAGSNYVVAERATVSESSPVFLLARLVADGPARDYLAGACPAEDYLLCRRPDLLGITADGIDPADYFLWVPGGARLTFGDTPRFVAEAAEIVRATIAAYPLEVAGHALRRGARQLVTLELSADMLPRPEWYTHVLFSRFDPYVYGAFLNARQTRGTFPRELFNGLHLAGLAAAAAVLAWLIATRYADLRGRLDGRVVGLLAVALAGFVGNALVTGGFSALHDRYQARVAWLVPLGAAVVLGALFRRPAPEAVSEPNDVEP